MENSIPTYDELARRLEEAQQKIVAQQAIIVDALTSGAAEHFFDDPKSRFQRMRAVLQGTNTNALTANNAKVAAAADELASRLEEAQQQLELYAAEMSEAKAAGFYSAQELWSAYQTAQQKIVAQQAHIMYLRGVLGFGPPYPPDVYYLAAHDAELTAEAKAEALEEGAAHVTRKYGPNSMKTDRHAAAEELLEKAAEYRVKATEAGRKE